MLQRYNTKRRPRRATRFGITAAVLVLAGTACSSATPQGDTGNGPWAPEQDIQMVVHASAGGSSDLLARTVAEILSNEGIVDKSVNVENRPGGSGAVAYTYVRSRSGDPHILSTTSGTYLGTPASGKADYCYKNYTHLAIFALDASLIVVPADSAFKTLDDLISAAKKDPGALRFGGTQAGGADSVIHALLQEKTGTKLSYVSFAGGGEVNAALLGDNVDVATGGPAELQSLLDAGRLRALGVSTSEPIEGLDVPTFREQGVDLVFTQSRGLIAPPGLTDAQRDFWGKALSRTANTPKWRKYIQKNLLVPELKVAQDAEQYVAKEWDRYVGIFRKLGFTPNPACGGKK